VIAATARFSSTSVSPGDGYDRANRQRRRARNERALRALAAFPLTAQPAQRCSNAPRYRWPPSPRCVEAQHRSLACVAQREARSVPLRALAPRAMTCLALYPQPRCVGRGRRAPQANDRTKGRARTPERSSSWSTRIRTGSDHRSTERVPIERAPIPPIRRAKATCVQRYGASTTTTHGLTAEVQPAALPSRSLRRRFSASARRCQRKEPSIRQAVRQGTRSLDGAAPTPMPSSMFGSAV